MNYLDDDDYPTMEACNKIRYWPENDFKGMMQFVKRLWKYSTDGYWTETEVNKTIEYGISTAGWSGNEDLLQAMGENGTFWIQCWIQSRRGGHYIFEVKDE